MVKKISRLRKYLTSFWDTNFLFSNVFIPLIVLTGYFIVFSLLLPQGVNKLFAEKSWQLTLLLAGLVGAVTFALFVSRKGKQSSFEQSKEKISSVDLILILLPMMPVVQYVVSNQVLLSWIEILYVLTIFFGFSFLFVIAIPMLLRGVASSRTLMLLGTAFTFTLTYMVSLTHQFSWFEKGSLRFQLPILAGVFVLSWLLYEFKQKPLLLLMIVVLFISNTAFHIFSPLEDNLPQPINIDNSNRLVQLVGEREPLTTPNIYLLVYDAYVSNETMLAYSIDNSLQEDFLLDRGFNIYPHTYSVKAASISTMTTIFNVSEFSDASRDAVAGNGVVQNLLKSFGYETFGIFPSDFFFRGIESSYDSSFPNPGLSAFLLSKGIFIGEFRFDLEFDKEPIENYLAAKRDVFRLNSQSPVFLYTHSKYPGHSQNSGICLNNEVSLFEERLKEANQEMRLDVEILLEHDPSSIIIIAGDHGPYLTKNCHVTAGVYDISEITRLDLQDRFGTFLAIRWPSTNFGNNDEITVLQDLFPSIFAFIFGDEKILDAEIEANTVDEARASGAAVIDGIIVGGIDDGEKLFLSGQ